MVESEENSDDQPLGSALTRLVCQVNRKLHTRCAATAREHDILPNEIEVVSTLGALGGLRMSDLANILAVAPPSATRIVKRLERREFVERRRSEQSDREVIVELTPKGRHLFEQCAPLLDAARTEFFDAVLSTEEQLLLSSMLARLNTDHEA